MHTYIGNGSYCYANSASMLVKTIGEDISPSLIEVLTGVGLGATWYEDEHTIFFSSVVPDEGVSKALDLLGFTYVEKSADATGPAPVEELRNDLAKGPVLLGPLDMGYLTYNPNAQYLAGCDHFVLAYRMDDEQIYLHDPAGFPVVALQLDQLERAWKAERIFDRLFSYHYLTSPDRILRPTDQELFHKALRSFQEVYRSPEQGGGGGGSNGKLTGRDAILQE